MDIESKKGVSLLLVVVLLSVLLSISVGVFTLVFGELRFAAEMEDSFVALYAADEGAERMLRRDLSPTPLVSGYTETNRSVSSGSGACETATVSKGGGVTSVSVTGIYRCDSSSRVVKRAFNLTYPTPQGPVAYWSMDDPTAGNQNPVSAADSSGNGNNGAIDLGTMWRTLDATWTDEALSFASTRKMAVPESATLSAQTAHPLTIMAWIFLPSTGTRTTIVRHGTAGSPTNGYELRIENNAQDLRFVAAFNPLNMARESGAAFTPNVWQLAAVSWDGSRFASGVKLYRYVTTDGNGDGEMDGGELTGGTSTNGLGSYVSPPSGTSFYIGNDAAGGRPLNGCVAEVRVWDRVLSAQEINAFVQAYAPPASPSPCP